MAQPKIGLQLIVYGNKVVEDLASVLREVAEVGYTGIEAGNLFATQGEALVRDLLAETGLAVAGMHSSYGDQTDPAKIEANIAYLKAVGAKYYINSGVANNDTLEGYEIAAETFNRVGAQCKREGLVFCYHNHAWEFKSLRREGHPPAHRVDGPGACQTLR